MEILINLHVLIMITLSVYELRTSLLHCPKTQEGLIPSARPQFHFVKRPLIRGVVSQQRVYVATVRRHLEPITKVPIVQSGGILNSQLRTLSSLFSL